MELIVRFAGRERRVEASVGDDGHWRIAFDDREYSIDAATLGRPDMLSMIVDGRQATASVRALGKGAYTVDGAELEVIDPRSRDFAADGERGGSGRFEGVAYMPGRVVALLAAEGDEVTKGQGILVLEAMKMENEIQSEIDGALEELLVEIGQTVDGGDPLFAVAPQTDR